MKALRPCGLIRRLLQHGHARTVLLLATRSLTIIGAAGTGEKSPDYVRIYFTCDVYRYSSATGTNLRKNLEKAWKWSKAQHEVANTLDASVSEGTVRKWQKMVSEYKQDKRKPNPFEEIDIGEFFVTRVRPVLIPR